ncbi:helix-turn-helix domain-containing protein [Sporosarcina sp. G11-34]|uniref:helix-turn-helix domain-containing protein n=1 Tax=Sporosarcina sp. G11-34 TaxID=2849605 RepID=UPI0022A91066|nr:Rgg/GadR/MutR family transcriptional regulator [Sporosarcina sp. G11-34]MCZ2259988.1 helix-turn-helix domain-containing protein [Sporosarcina sp. G11-34]
MVMGAAFKIIRKNKGLSQKEVAADIISTSFYSKLENENSNISADLFFQVLDNLDIALEEFEYIYNDYSHTSKKKIDDECKQIYYAGDITKLEEKKNEVEEIYKSTGDDFYNRLAILLYCLIQTYNSEKYDPEIINPIQSYLFSVETWGHYEIRLFTTCIKAFEVDTVLLLSNQLLNNLKPYSTYNFHERDIITVLINIIITCLDNNRLEEADYYIAVAKKRLTSEKIMFERNLINYLFGISLIHHLKSDEGYLIAMTSIDIFNSLNMNGMATQYEQYLEETIKNFSE